MVIIISQPKHIILIITILYLNKYYCYYVELFLIYDIYGIKKAKVGKSQLNKVQFKKEFKKVQLLKMLFNKVKDESSTFNIFLLYIVVVNKTQCITVE